MLKSLVSRFCKISENGIIGLGMTQKKVIFLVVGSLGGQATKEKDLSSKLKKKFTKKYDHLHEGEGVGRALVVGPQKKLRLPLAD